jgi:hypothetical protein
VALGGPTSALATVPVFLLVSTDGVQWTRVADASMPATGEFGKTATVVQQPGVAGGFGTIVQHPAPAPITALTADGGRVLALTIDRDVRWRPGDNATINHIAPAAWESADGRSWSRVDRPVPYATGEWTYDTPWPAQVNAAVQAGGVLWAGGTMARAAGQRTMDAAVWASTDRGVRWAALQNTWQGLLSGDRGPAIAGLAYARGTLVAVGAENDVTPVAWRAAPPGR